ncbi:MAG: class I SAM-dependent methyltransferase [Solirubrobacteraceae bacterium]
MSGITDENQLREPVPSPAITYEARDELARHFIRGSGLEIGAAYGPLQVLPGTSVTYVDRMTVDELRDHYPELAELIIPVDVVDDGERLTTVPDESQDFIIANHFLEHCEDPIGAIESHLRKLKPGGILFYAVPDKRYTFDFRRPVTPLEHMISDHHHGPERSRDEHYEEWARLVDGHNSASDLDAANYSIHMHVWTQAEFLELLLHCRRQFADSFEIEAFARRSLEIVVVLRKAGELAEMVGLPPTGNAATAAAPATEAQMIAALDVQLKDATARLRRVEGSVTWQLFQRVRGRTFALLGGEESRVVTRIQSALRWTGKVFLRGQP